MRRTVKAGLAASVLGLTVLSGIASATTAPVMHVVRTSVRPAGTIRTVTCMALDNYTYYYDTIAGDLQATSGTDEFGAVNGTPQDYAFSYAAYVLQKRIGTTGKVLGSNGKTVQAGLPYTWPGALKSGGDAVTLTPTAGAYAVWQRSGKIQHINANGTLGSVETASATDGFIGTVVRTCSDGSMEIVSVVDGQEVDETVASKSTGLNFLSVLPSPAVKPETLTLMNASAVPVTVDVSNSGAGDRTVTLAKHTAMSTSMWPVDATLTPATITITRGSTTVATLAGVIGGRATVNVG